MCSGPVWAIIVGHFCNNWGFYNLLTCLPSYLNNVLRYDIKHAGFIAGLPYVCMAVWGNIWAPIVDRCRKKSPSSTGKCVGNENTVCNSRRRVPARGKTTVVFARSNNWFLLQFFVLTRVLHSKIGRRTLAKDFAICRALDWGRGASGMWICALRRDWAHIRYGVPLCGGRGRRIRSLWFQRQSPRRCSKVCGRADGRDQHICHYPRICCSAVHKADDKRSERPPGLPVGSLRGPTKEAAAGLANCFFHCSGDLCGRRIDIHSNGLW